MKFDIVTRLRNPPFGTETSERNIMDAAADEIERLRAENATARQEAERLTLHHIELRDAQRRRAERAEAQVAALREALALFACDCAPKIECADPSYCRNSIARAALEEK